jgi:hypothetical protein
MRNSKNNYKNIKFRVLPIPNNKKVYLLWERVIELELNKINNDQNKYRKPINISYKNRKYINN